MHFKFEYAKNLLVYLATKLFVGQLALYFHMYSRFFVIYIHIDVLFNLIILLNFDISFQNITWVYVNTVNLNKCTNFNIKITVRSV